MDWRVWCRACRSILGAKSYLDIGKDDKSLAAAVTRMCSQPQAATASCLRRRDSAALKSLQLLEE
jgi:hypothetical protein